MPRLLYIASLPHSGSTLLNLLVGNSPQMIGLGGIDRATKMLVESPEKTQASECSCGSIVRDCRYWGSVAARLAKGDTTKRIDRYRVALEEFESTFGTSMLPVDSSKIKEPIIDLAAAKDLDLDLRVVHLAKDFRTAVISAIDTKRRKNATKSPGAYLALKAAHKWLRENGKLERCLKQNNVEHFNLGYEELCLNFNYAFGALCEFAGADHDPHQSLRINDSTSHLFIGNRMRNQSEKAELRYDYRWFSRREWMAPAVLLPLVYRGNAKWVYTGSGIKAFKA